MPMPDDVDDHSGTDPAHLLADQPPAPDKSDPHWKPPLAKYCCICGNGYDPDQEIEIIVTPIDDKHQWAHRLCTRTHGEVFLETFKDTPLRFDE